MLNIDEINNLNKSWAGKLFEKLKFFNKPITYKLNCFTNNGGYITFHTEPKIHCYDEYICVITNYYSAEGIVFNQDIIFLLVKKLIWFLDKEYPDYTVVDWTTGHKRTFWYNKPTIIKIDKKNHSKKLDLYDTY